MRLTFARSLINDPSCCSSTSPPPGWTQNARKIKDIIVDLKARAARSFLTTWLPPDEPKSGDRGVRRRDGRIVALTVPIELKIASAAGGGCGWNTGATAGDS